MIKKPWRMREGGSTKPLVTFEVLSTHKGWWSFSKAWGTEDLLSAEPGITAKESEYTQTSERRIRREWLFSCCILYSGITLEQSGEKTLNNRSQQTPLIKYLDIEMFSKAVGELVFVKRGRIYWKLIGINIYSWSCRHRQ